MPMKRYIAFISAVVHLALGFAFLKAVSCTGTGQLSLESPKETYLYII